MKKLICLLISMGSVALQAQTIKGYVSSEKDKTPIEYATVSLRHLPDSAITKGVATTTSGQYLFNEVKPGKYFIKVTSVGFQPAGKSIVLPAGTNNLQVDTIYMAVNSKQIAEVTVAGERIKGKELVDRTVYTIPPAIAKASTNGFEILKKIPSVQVDFNNNITLNGSTNFLIQVDGKVRDKEFLAKLLPTDIESVEVITNPSGKYEGTIDGVINIILKKEARVGMSGNFSGGIRTYKEISGGLNGSLDYGVGKFSFYATGYTFYQKLSVFNSSYTDLINFKTITDLKGTGKFKLSATSFNTGFDYYVNDKNNLSFNINFKPIVQDINTAGRGPASFDTTNLFYNYLPTTNTSSDEVNVSLFYKKQYKKPIQELTSEIRYYNFKSTGDNEYISHYALSENSANLDTTDRKENNIDKRYAITAKIDYVYPIGISWRLETGYQLYYQSMNYNYSNDQEISHELPSHAKNTFNYIETRNAGYAGLTYNYKKWGFQTNLRAEYSMVDKAPDYPSFLPSANLQYKITGTQNLKLTYNVRINRPGLTDLDPFQKVSGTVWTAGNPNLKPEYRNKFQLTYTINLGKNYFSPNIYYDKFTNKIGLLINDFTNPDGTPTTISIPNNVLTGYEQGFGLNALLWFFNINARVYQGHYDSYTGSAFRIPFKSYNSFALNSYVYGQLPLKLNGFAFISYNGPNINAQSKTTSTPFYGFGAQKIMGNHTVGFFYLLPFSQNITLSETTTNSPGYYSKTSYGFNVSYYIQVSYTYKFNRGRTVKKITRKEESESDSKTEGIQTK